MVTEIKITLFCLFLFISQGLYSQNFENGRSEQQLAKEAFAAFSSSNHSKAYPLYNELLSFFPQDPDYNYYMGICQVELNKDIPNAIQRLKIASSKNVNSQVSYYLGRAFHVNYEFNSAIRYYQKYKESVRKEQPIIDRRIQMCKNGQSQVNSHLVLDVASIEEVKYEMVLEYYDMEGVSNRLVKKDKSLLSKYDGSVNDNEEIACVSSNGEYIYFTSSGKKNKQSRDIYRAKRSKNGSWGKWEELDILNSEFSELYPFMSSDGRTLYFSSQGHSSIGGFDIFKSIYNEISDTWSEPENIGFPINSTSNDLLYVNYDSEDKACFVSGRVGESYTLYKLKNNKNITKKAVVDSGSLSSIALFKNVEKEVNESSYKDLAPKLMKKYSLENLPYFNFEIYNELVYHYLSEFKSDESRSLYLSAQNDAFNSDSLKDKGRASSEFRT